MQDGGGEDAHHEEETMARVVADGARDASTDGPDGTTAIDPTGDQRRRRQLKEASQRCRKRQKHEAIMFTTQISALRQEIAEIRAKLEAMASSTMQRSRARAEERYELERRVAFVKAKLVEHCRWMQQVRTLMAAAPLLNLVNAEETRTVESHCSNTLNDGGAGCPKLLPPAIPPFSNSVIEDHLRRAVRSCAVNAQRLLIEFKRPKSAFQEEFNSRGWTIGASAQHQLITFRASRRLLSAVAQEIAAEVWRSIQREDIFRTFCPVILDCTSIIEAPMHQLSRRVIAVDNVDAPQVLVTVEALVKPTTDKDGWVICLETCRDALLSVFAAERSSDHLAPPGAGSGRPEVYERGSDLKVPEPLQVEDVSLAAACYQQGSDMRIDLVGSIQHDGGHDGHLHFRLLQYLASVLPVFEDVHLGPKSVIPTGDSV